MSQNPLYTQNPFYTSNFILIILHFLILSGIYTIYAIFFITIFYLRSFYTFFNFRSFQSLLFSFISILFVNNILLSVNSVSFPSFVFITLFRLHETFSFPFSCYLSHNIFFSQFPHLHLISRFVLSLFCRSLLVALTARNQYIPLHISYPYFEPPSRPLPLILIHQSHNAAILITSTSSLFHSISFRS